MNKRIFLILLVFILIGGFLRFYKITHNPPSLTGDEISFGYAAYSLMQTGRDESGKFLPIVIQSIGDYKNPLPAYLMVIFFKIFGVNDFGIRFWNAIFGVLTIPFLYFFVKDILNNKKLALISSLFLSVSAWHIFYSRFAYEPMIASFFAMLGIWFFIKMLDGDKKYAFLSALFFVLTMYTGFAQRLFVPLFVAAVILYYAPTLYNKKQNSALFILTCIILGLPLVYVSLFQGASTRFSMVFIANDIDFVRYVNFNYLSKIQELPQLFFFWTRRYLNYLQPDFIFFNALQMTLPGYIGLGLLYMYELPFLIVGTIQFIKKKIPYKAVFVIWLLTGIIPDSITNNEQHAGRLLHLVPLIMILLSLGAIKTVEIIKSLKSIYLKILIIGTYSLLVVLILIHAILVFTVHFPKHKGESFDEGLRETAYYVDLHQDEYEEVVYDIRRGIDGPFMVSNPHMYLLFYTKYDPAKYQKIEKFYSSDKDIPEFKFDKYSFRFINWQKDKEMKDTLFIGSPWSFPANLSQQEILEIIYLSSGDPAFYIVSPK